MEETYECLQQQQPGSKCKPDKHADEQTDDELEELVAVEKHLNGNGPEGSPSCGCEFTQKEVTEFRKRSYYPLLVFIVAGVMVACLGLLFTHLTGNKIVFRCFIALGGLSVVVGLGFQFRRYLVVKQCAVVERCLGIEDYKAT